jgi:hypothetical protein
LLKDDKRFKDKINDSKTDSSTVNFCEETTLSTKEAKETNNEGFIANWKANSLEIRIMDLATVAWAVISIIELIFIIVDIEVNSRIIPGILLPLLMVVITFSLRLRLQEKPEKRDTIFWTWAILFILFFIGTFLILLFYPPLT